MWYLIWDKQIETLENVFLQTGIKPTALLERPEIPDILFDFYKAFLILYRQKQDPKMALKIADIYFYLQLFPEISDTEIFVEVVIYLDFVCLEFNMGKANDGNFENS